MCDESGEMNSGQEIFPGEIAASSSDKQGVLQKQRSVTFGVSRRRQQGEHLRRF
jgi:hypothetical protein